MLERNKVLLSVLGAGIVVAGIVFVVTVGGRDAMAQVALEDKAALISAYQVEARDTPAAVEEAAYGVYLTASGVAKKAAADVRAAALAGAPAAGTAEHDTLLEALFQAEATVAQARADLDTARRVRAEIAPEARLAAIYKQRCAQPGAPVALCWQFREPPDGGP